MTTSRETSLSLTARIGRIIAEENPVIPCSDTLLRRAMRDYSRQDLRQMQQIGLIPQDFETYYVVREFLHRTGINREAGGDYLLALFSAARRQDAQAFASDPYLSLVSCPTVRQGDILLTTASYEKGELFLYDMPDLSAGLVVPRLGYFDRKVTFPAVYQGSMPWMSVCPSEINSTRASIAAAHGRVLVLGLGLGYYPFMISLREDVTSVTVVELQQPIIDLFLTHLFPRFPHRDKIQVVKADALAYLQEVKDGMFDCCFADIWESVTDGAVPYVRIREQEKRLPSTRFDYWIGEQIQAFLRES